MTTAFSKSLASCMTAAFAFCLAAAPAEAAPTKKKHPGASAPVKNVSLRRQAAPQKPPSRPANCTKEQFAHAVRTDLVFDLQTGEVIYSNLNAEEREKQTIYPASLTKVEAIKEIIDRVRTGIWESGQMFKVQLPKQSPVNLSLKDIVLASANPSLNVIDSIADKTFLEGMRRRLEEIGASNAKYITATGLPVREDIRAGHVTTLADLAKSVRDFELNYATKEVSQEVFGIDRITGIWNLNIPNVHRTRHTIRIMEDATGPGAAPYPGITSGKSGYTCDFGFGSYVRYEAADRPFIIMTTGHVGSQLRDEHTVRLIESNKAGMDNFVEPLIGPPAPEGPPPAIVTMTPLLNPPELAR